jgi:uncharacterized protein YbbC (DUF1343 family)
MRCWFLFSLIAGLILINGNDAIAQKHMSHPQDCISGAARMDQYLPLLKGKKVALLINQTARVGEKLLVDTLLSRKVNVVKIFVPEHGLRGAADAGAHVSNDKDAATGLPVISLYGKNKKPSKEQLKDVDVVVYDLQDVGVRFYTYISSLEYLMEACAENDKELIVLDRPNPNGFYVDGPVLEESNRSFVGMQEIPVVYGMTVGEYAKMLVGEKWIDDAKDVNLKVIPCAAYDHSKKYQLPVSPSPNLKNMAAIYLYPSLCFFEGTVVSVGRGTEKPFQQWGHPAFKSNSDYFFTPKAMTGASKPMYEGQKCYGQFITDDPQVALRDIKDGLNLDWLIKAYQWYPEKGKFFNNFFKTLAGTDKLQKMIEKGMSAAAIKASWQKDIDAFKEIRKKYLLYPDFE